MKRSAMSMSVLIPLLSLSIVVLFVLDVLLGSVSISFSEFMTVLKGGGTETSRNIIFLFRLPKAFVALLVGAALSASGLQMQTLFRNPLAGPYVLGISSGASLGVAIFLLGLPLGGAALSGVLWMKNIGIVAAAWLGSAAILMVIVAVSSRIKDIMAVLIIGMMFGSMASAFVEILQFAGTESGVKSFVIWTMGSLGDVTLDQLYIMLPFVLAGLVMSIYLIKPLNLLMLGENYAGTMGLNVKATRMTIFISTILLAGTVTAFCGPIGFIGIAVPHMARMITMNADHRVLMPVSILLGANTLLACDIILSMLSRPLPINTITAIIGIPIVIIVILRKSRI